MSAQLRAFFGIWTVRGPDLQGEWSEAGLFKGWSQLTTRFRMDQIVNTLSIYAVENGLLTRYVSSASDTGQISQLSPFR